MTTGAVVTTARPVAQVKTSWLNSQFTERASSEALRKINVNNRKARKSTITTPKVLLKVVLKGSNGKQQGIYKTRSSQALGLESFNTKYIDYN
jgi:hypothetical protein